MGDGIKDDLKSAGKAVVSKVNEVADRGRAAGHDAAAETRDNPLEAVGDKLKATGDRARAEGHEAKANVEAKDAKD